MGFGLSETDPVWLLARVSLLWKGSAGLGHSHIASLSDLTCAGDTGAQRVASAAPTHSSWLCEHGEAITPESAAWEPAFYPGTNLDTRD